MEARNRSVHGTNFAVSIEAASGVTTGISAADRAHTIKVASSPKATPRDIVHVLAAMWRGMPGMGHSGAARAGMLNFTETAALEWAPVRVNAVAPGWIASSGMDRYPPEMAAAIRSLPSLAPLPRLPSRRVLARRP